MECYIPNGARIYQDKGDEEMKHKFTHKGLTYHLKYDKVGPVTRGALHLQGGVLLNEDYAVCSLKDHFSALKGRKLVTARLLIEQFKDKEDREAIWQQLLSK